MSLLGKTCRLYRALAQFSEAAFSPLLDLAIRLWMARIFFTSGWSKFSNYLNGDWGATVFLFKEEHPLPGIAPETAAIMGTAGELILPVLLAFGLGGRFAAAGLLIMTGVIEFLVPNYSNPQHYLWMLLLAVPLLKGPGKISLDYILGRTLFKNHA